MRGTAETLLGFGLALGLVGLVSLAGCSDFGEDETSTSAGAPSLVTNGDFARGCAGFTSASGTVKTADTGNRGAPSCRVCNTGKGDFALRYETRLAVQRGDEYVGEAWIRAAPGVPASAMRLRLLANPAGASPQSVTTPIAPGPSFERATVMMSSTVEAPSLRFEIEADGALGEVCFEVDDVSLAKVR